MRRSLEGRTAIVTGSTRGIGLGIATELVARGANVVVNGLVADEVEAAALALGPEAVVSGCAADVREPADVDRLTSHALETYGGLDILVNNAALANPVSHFLELDPAGWAQVMRANLDSVFLCSRYAAEAMVHRRTPGRIVNISSFGALRAHRRLAAYDTAKGGVEALTRAVALDLAPFNITVNSVAPGPIHTEGTAATAPRPTARGDLVPLGRVGTPQEIGHAVAFLSSDEAAFITGQCLVVDGGATAQLRPPPSDSPQPDTTELSTFPRLLSTRPTKGPDE